MGQEIDLGELFDLRVILKNPRLNDFFPKLPDRRREPDLIQRIPAKIIGFDPWAQVRPGPLLGKLIPGTGDLPGKGNDLGLKLLPLRAGNKGLQEIRKTGIGLKKISPVEGMKLSQLFDNRLFQRLLPN